MSLPPKQRGRPKDEQLTARRQDEILDVAGRIFAARGYPNTDLQVVANEIGVGKGTIYRYFASKQELFLAAVDRAIRRGSDQVDASTTAADPLEQMQQAVRAYLAYFQANPEVVELLIQERAEFKDRKKPTYFIHSDEGVLKWHAVLRELIAAGRVRDIPVERITNVLGDLLYGTMFTNYFAHRRRSLEEQADEILDIALLGILTDAGREHWAGARLDPSPQRQPGQRRVDGER
jgi:AcrR family transcriptional regulator